MSAELDAQPPSAAAPSATIPRIRIFADSPTHNHQAQPGGESNRGHKKAAVGLGIVTGVTTLRWPVPLRLQPELVDEGTFELLHHLLSAAPAAGALAR